MDISELLTKERVKFDLKSDSKEKVLDELISLLYKDGIIKDDKRFKQVVMKREEEFSTGIGMGIAIPHGKDNTVVKPALAFGLSKSGIDYKSMDGEPAKIFFLIAVPEKSDNMHLQILSTISRKLMHEEVREKLYNSKTYEDILKAFES
jgi:PTS system nitrogen regulatory IIA component